MDTSKLYIEMSHGAYPYMESRFRHLYNAIPFGTYDPVYYCKCGESWEPITGHNPIKAEAQGHWRIWLPRQSNIQRILADVDKRKPSRSPMGQINDLAHWAESSYPYASRFKSMEQLWLAYFMVVKFLKRWDGRSGWINST